MYEVAERFIDFYHHHDRAIELVSGGAAWADHVAVRLFLDGKASSLTLHLPCPFVDGKYLDTGSNDWRTNPGQSANYYHQKFSQAMGCDTLADIQTAISKGANVVVGAGFHQRNSQIAKSDVLLAFTWAVGDTPSDGGTLDTWNKCKAPKLHVQLNSLK
jgi:hypothetical protein